MLGNGRVIVSGDRNRRRPVRKSTRGNGSHGVRLYDARASCFTYLADEGVPDHLFTGRAGHTNVRTTDEWYVKPDVAGLPPAAEARGGPQGACDRS